MPRDHLDVRELPSGTVTLFIRKLAGPEFDRGHDEGRALTLDDAVSLALAPADELPG